MSITEQSLPVGGRCAMGRRIQWMKRESSIRRAYFCLMFLFALECHGLISAAGNFSLQSASFNCSSNVICLGNVHEIVVGSEVAGLALIEGEPVGGNWATFSAGLAYYHEPVRLLDTSSHQAASFNTSFVVDTVHQNYDGVNDGDGFAFVISTDNKINKTIGGVAEHLGIFDQYTGNTTFKSIIVEFDAYKNTDVNDINDNHVSFDFVTINWTAAADASTVKVKMGDNKTLYAWVEYSSQTQQLEVRVRNNNTRPISPLLNHTVDLFSVVEEYVWLGFSAGTGYSPCNYFVRNWNFESCGILPSSQVKSRPRIVLISACLLVLLLACVSTIAAVYIKCGRKGSCKTHWHLGCTKFVVEETVVQLKGIPERYTYKQLRMATGNFSKESKLGQGGFGSVYRGVLPSGTPTAVKKINGDSTQGEKAFMAEVSIISQLKHRNLIQLLGWCKDASRGNYLLVYELMPNGSLDKVLFGPAVTGKACLSWPQRFHIVRDTAAALDYLHQGWTQQVLHRDIKSSNIMLDEEWNAKLGDFGLARFVDHERPATTTNVAGTYGYIAPEVPVTGKFTDKSDVYGFGVVVLEVACGRKALCVHLPEDQMFLVNWVWQRLTEGDLLSSVDHRLECYDMCWMEVMLKLGLLCSHPNPLARPTMRQVVQILAREAPLPSIPAFGPFLSLRGVSNEGLVSPKTQENI